MTGYSRGEVVLVGFIFSDESGTKRRPAVIVSSKTYQDGREEVVIMAITSTTERILEGDHLMADWQPAGLLYPSVATGIIRTIKSNMIVKSLGSLSERDMTAVDDKLRMIFRLS